MGSLEELKIVVNTQIEKANADIAKLNKGFNKFTIGITQGTKALKTNQVQIAKTTDRLNILKTDLKTVNTLVQKSKGMPAFTKKVVVQGAIDSLKKMKSGLTDIRGELKANTVAAGSFSGELLSIMFFGMQMKATFTKALTSMFEVYKKIIPENDAWNKSTVKLSAAWTFFKFRIADALAKSPFIQNMIEMTVNFLNWLSRLNPAWQKFIGYAIAAGAALGSVLFTIGVVGLGLFGIQSTMRAIKAAEVFTALGTSLSAFSQKVSNFTWGDLKKYKWLAAGLLGFMAIKVAVDNFTDSSDYGREAVDNMEEGFLGLINTVLPDFSTGLDNSSTKINDFTEMSVFMGSIVVSAFSAIGNTLSLIVTVLKTVYYMFKFFTTLITGTVVTAIGMLIDAFIALFDAIAGIENSDPFKFTNMFSGRAVKLLKADISDMEKTWSDYVDNTQKFSAGITDPYKAVEEYRNTVKDLNLKQQLKADKVTMNDLPRIEAPPESTQPSKVEKITNQVILNIEGTPQAYDLSDGSFMQLVTDYLKQQGYISDDTNTSGFKKLG